MFLFCNRFCNTFVFVQSNAIIILTLFNINNSGLLWFYLILKHVLLQHQKNLINPNTIQTKFQSNLYLYSLPQTALTQTTIAAPSLAAKESTTHFRSPSELLRSGRQPRATGLDCHAFRVQPTQGKRQRSVLLCRAQSLQTDARPRQVHRIVVERQKEREKVLIIYIYILTHHIACHPSRANT